MYTVIYMYTCPGAVPGGYNALPIPLLMVLLEAETEAREVFLY